MKRPWWSSRDWEPKVIKLPEADGTLTSYEPNASPRVFTPDDSPFAKRSPLATAHVLGDPLAANEPFGPPMGPPPPQPIDWEASMAYRRHLWAHGYTLAEALDTAHRGMGLDWPTSVELIRHSAAEARAVGGRMAVAITTDQLDPFSPASVKDVRLAYEQQLEVVESAGATAIIMCSPQLAAATQDPADYAELYGALLRQCSKPAILHWITSVWDPRHTGYWGQMDVDSAYGALLAIVRDNIDKVDGVKVALLPAEQQVQMRRLLPEGVRFYTSDTDRYPELFAGDEQGFSDGLTPVFDPIAPLAAEALRALDRGDTAHGRQLLDSTVPLCAHLFEGPGRSTFFFKTGLVFLGWLGGHSAHTRMVWGEQSARSVPHLATAYRLADGLGLFADPALAEQRMKTYLATYGIAQ
ncbi:DUF993 family protein [Streptomyces sp. NBC_00448]|uniref:DUF993 family protein n=1 Tax=Streptomyces sp. NBC_00448 TaxID=2903652 RepID=UPI003FA7C5FE